MEIRVKLNKSLTAMVDKTVEEYGFGSRPELARQAIREFIFKHETELSRDLRNIEK